jgi:NAD(P)-dependent dehydrogenase (short-subunit alcohol dehydrogenase family)
VNRRVVVTGGAKGIGRAIGEAFRALGDEVEALGRSECDVTDEESVTRAFDALGAVDVLVNNAGIAESEPLHRTTLEDWRRHMDVNATGAFLCARAVLPGMRERGHGVIVNIASTAGLTGTPYTAAYTASKHALIGLTRAAAAELAGTGIRINAVCPSFVRTDLVARSVQRIVQRTGRSPEEALQALTGGALIEPEEVAGAVVYLASDAARSLSGQAIVIDGGQPHRVS